jgi:hypothetical protein
MPITVNPHSSFTVPVAIGTSTAVPVSFQNQFQGLQVYLDASITSSYPGSGTTWFDISGNARNVSLSGPTFSADLGGALSFGAGGQGIGSSMPWLSDSFTLSVWVRPTTVDSSVRRFVTMQAGAERGFANWATSRLDGANGFEQYHGFTSTNNGIFTSVRVNSQVKVNQYQNFVITYSGQSQQIRTLKNNTLSGIASATIPGILDATVTGNNMILGSGAESFLGNMYIVLLYDRAMSDPELTQLYNYFKSRFGL